MLSALLTLAATIAIGLAAVLASVRFAIVHPRHPGRPRYDPLDAGGTALARRLEAHVRAVASRPHNLFYPEALEQAATYIETQLVNAGLSPIRHEYDCDQGRVRNIEVILEAAPSAQTAGRRTPTLVIGAHYDSPDDSPGANDNGSGVAALVEIARMLGAPGSSSGERTHRVRLVFFVNEELPWGKTPDMGSWRHAKMLKESGDSVVGMLALETLGYFSDEPGSQKFPCPFGLIYGDRGDFVAFVGMLGARSFVHRLVGSFRRNCDVPSIGGVAPSLIEGIDLSDHWAYDKFGFPAAMVTDTAPFRNPCYHKSFDTPDRVDYPMLARITAGLAETIAEIATAPVR